MNRKQRLIENKRREEQTCHCDVDQEKGAKFNVAKLWTPNHPKLWFRKGKVMFRLKKIALHINFRPRLEKETPRRQTQLSPRIRRVLPSHSDHGRHIVVCPLRSVPKTGGFSREMRFFDLKNSPFKSIFDYVWKKGHHSSPRIRRLLPCHSGRGRHICAVPPATKNVTRSQTSFHTSTTMYTN